MGDVVLFTAMGDFPNRLNELRRARGLSQEGLAELLGCSKMQISRLENGKNDLTLTWMKRIAHVLGVEPADLLTEEDNPMRLRSDEKHLIERYRSADPGRQRDIQQLTETLIPFEPEPRHKGAA